MRKYELSNHLGNVLAVVTDRKITYMPGEFCHNSTSGFVQNADGTLSAITSSWGRAGNSTSSTVYNAKVLWRNAGTSLTSETCMVGLSYSPASRFNYIDYAIYLQYGSRYYVYERGRNKTSRSSATYVTGDVPVVERIDGKIYYYIMRDGVRINLRTKTETRPNTPLYLSYDSYRSGATLDLSFQTSEKAHYVADYVSVSDYYPFGMQMQGRTWSAGDGYRFAFNGYENEPEIAGQGSVIDFGARIYDSRLGKFFSTDPIVYAYWSPYQYDGNSPIGIKDVLGMGPDVGDLPNERGPGMMGDGQESSPLPDKVEWNKPLTTHLLRAQARKEGVTGSGVTFNRKVGKAFEFMALVDNFVVPNYKPFKSKARSAATVGKVSTVIPDGVNPVKIFGLGGRSWIPRRRTFRNGSFYEAKAVGSPIRLSSSRYQIRGLIDAAANTEAGRNGYAQLKFITTSNTYISSKVIAYADSKGVNIWQSVAYINQDGKIGFSGFYKLNKVQTQVSLQPIWNALKPDVLGFKYTVTGVVTWPEIPINPDDELLE